MNIKTPILLLFAAFSLATHSYATVVYQEDFAGTDSDPLAGTEPAYSPNGQTWTGNANYYQDGSYDASGAVWLPFTGDAALAVNSEYSITLVLDMIETTNSSWGALGFSAAVAPTGGGFTNNGDSSRSWFVARSNGLSSAWGGNSTGNQWADNQDIFTPGADTTMVLYLTTGGTLADSSVDMSINGVFLDLNGGDPGTTRTSVDASIFTHVGFGTSGPGYVTDFTSFELALIPEPSTLILVTLAMGMLVGFRRRKI